MNTNLILCILSIILILTFMVASLWLTRPRCPECKSLKINEIAKNPLSMRGVDMSPGHGGGGFGTAQVLYEVTYRCSTCQATWTVTKSETT